VKIEDRGSRIEDRRSRIKDRGSKIEDKIHKDVMIEFLRQEPRGEFSEMIEQLLAQWLKTRT